MDRSGAEVLISRDGTEFYGRAAAAFAELSARAMERSGRFSVALSGGSTPLPLYALLASEIFRERVRWERVQFFWSDERCVPPDHEDSNYRGAALNLLERLGVDEGQVHRIRGELGEEAAGAYELELRRAFGLSVGEVPVFDLILLGMGADGHTASIFPGSAVLAERERLAAPVYVESLRSLRVTLTPPVILGAKEVFFLVRGRDKAPALRAVLEGRADEGRYPASIWRRARGRVRWFIDEPAASMLGGP